ncbi:MAG: 30S ribosomal protein S12 methylthiotransferase RimO [Oscillospiraceae bacterium]|nr:30S ribosomal protein S12 methylthiotransferase RimO [Oscillospiraceae bacterium]
MKVTLVSLGCPKNQVDSDIIAHGLLKAGHTTTADMTEADVCVINTCGFITSAKEEAIENIFNAVGARLENPKLKIVVTGCLAERYKDEIMTDIPEVDAVVGIGAHDKLLEVMESVTKGEKLSCYGPKTNLDITKKRIISTPRHYAYLKIAEGCSNGCYYCAIPLIRGPHRSRPMESCIEEAKWLAEEGVREIIVVAQDITRYGEDIYKENKLAELVTEISKIDGIDWIHLMYAYPERLGDDVIDVIATNPKVLHYLDLPIQHINDRVLKSMNRKGGTDIIMSAINRLRAKVPDISIRTSLITGYPGETEEEFQQLYDFVKEIKLERLGCFAYSEEEGTKAATMEQMPMEERQRRADLIMQLQTGIMADKQAAMVGRDIEVIVDDYDSENELFICRSVYDAPEIDGEVYISGDWPVMVGEIYTVHITESDIYDLYGELVED